MVSINNTIKAKSISYGNSRSASQIKYIVFHYTGNKTDKAVSNAKYYRDTNTREAGAHYFVDDTSIYQSIDDTKIAWSVGGKVVTTTNGAASKHNVVTNSNSISIEMCSTNGAISNATLNNVIDLAVTLMKKYNIPVANLYRHWDVTGKACPGWTGWIGTNQTLWNNLKNSISSKMNAGATTTAAASKSLTLPTGTLKKGNSGTAVKNLQTALNALASQGLKCDGSYGDKTVAAVKNVQAWGVNVDHKKLTCDGIYGPATRAYMVELAKNNGYTVK